MSHSVVIHHIAAHSAENSKRGWTEEIQVAVLIMYLTKVLLLSLSSVYFTKDLFLVHETGSLFYHF